MSEPTPAELLTFLQDHGFLSPPQAQQAGAATKSGDTRALARELVERNWITSYQADQLLQGRGAGLVLGPYHVLDKLGEGGMGQVFKARHVGMDRLVALKVIPREFVANHVALERFRREVRAVAKLSHPNIVTAFDVGQSGETHYLAMEYLDGIDLARLVQQSGPLPVLNACQYVRQAAVGLQHAHERGLVHRDIKPGNLMVVRPGPDEPPVVKILDFGLARFESEAPQGVRLTQLGKVVGTVDYIAPEQAANARTADIRADIYSLGCSLYYLLTGKAPFVGSSVVEKIGARALGEAPSVRKSRPEVSPALERILAKMMAPDPAERYQTPGEVAKALEPHTLDEKQVRPAQAADRPAPPARREPARSPWDFDREGGGEVRRPPRRGLPGWVWLAGSAAAVAVVVVVVLVVRNGSRPKTPDGPPVAAKGPGGDDRPKGADKAKDTDTDRKKDKKDKTDIPKKPAPLPRLVAFPKLSLPERGAADLQVKVERQGYAGPIKLQVENLPPGVTCQRSATIPAGESSLRLVFRTDGTAAERTATVEVIATADTRTADRQKLALLFPPKSAASAKRPEPLPTTWSSLASMPTARSLLAAVTGPDGRIYAIGGENASGSLGTVEVYDPSTNKWTTVTPMPTARIHLAATMGPDKLIYAIGGVSGVPNIVEAYNPSTNKWTTVAPIPTARHGLAAVTGPDGRIYAIGGNGPGGSLNTVEAYDTKSDIWTTVASMPTARVYLAAAMGSDGRIYAIGGFQEGDGKRLNTVEAYDTKTNKWTPVASMTTARNAHAAATGPDGRIYAIGGHTVGGMPNTVEAYDPSTNTWTPVASMPTVRGQLAAATGRDGRIYAIGGGGNVRFLNTVEALSFSTSKPKP
jgi:serine/threonine protein kinase/N-acetylneuraminic acid mutarotase